MIQRILISLLLRVSKSIGGQVQADAPEFESKSNSENQNFEISQIVLVKTAGKCL